jgi:uncharacterized protein (DUF983 family)
MKRFWLLLWRGLIWRCPVCGRGHLFRGVFRMNEYCPFCHFKFEREEGYYTSSMAINIVVSELLVTIAVLPLAYDLSAPLLPILLIGSPMVLLLPVLLFRHSRSLWLTMDHYFNPVSAIDLPPMQPLPGQNWEEEPKSGTGS